MAIGKKNVESIIKSYFESKEGKKFKETALSISCPTNDQLIKFDSGGLEEKASKEIRRHLVFCTKCIKRIILQRGLQVEELEGAIAEPGLSSLIKELINSIFKGLRGLEIFPVLKPALACSRARGGEGKGEEKGENGMEISRSKEEVLSLQLEAPKGYQLVLLLETPNNLIRLIYPNTKTDFVEQDGRVFTIKFRGKKDALLGNYTLRALAIKDYVIEQINLTFDDIVGHKKIIEEILGHVNKQLENSVLGNVFRWKVKE